MIAADLEQTSRVTLAHVPGERLGRPSLDVTPAQLGAFDLASTGDEHDGPLMPVSQPDRGVHPVSRHRPNPQTRRYPWHPVPTLHAALPPWTSGSELPAGQHRVQPRSRAFGAECLSHRTAF